MRGERRERDGAAALTSGLGGPGNRAAPRPEASTELPSRAQGLSRLLPEVLGGGAGPVPD